MKNRYIKGEIILIEESIPAIGMLAQMDKDFIVPIDSSIVLWNLENVVPISAKYFHLYIYSNEEIKVGDIQIRITSSGEKFVEKVTNSTYTFVSERYYKVISTTNVSVFYDTPAIESTTTLDYDDSTFLSSHLSTDWVKKYTDEFCRGNEINFVIIRYKGNEFFFDILEYNQMYEQSELRNKIVELCKSAFITGTRLNDLTFDEWLNINLPKI